MFLFGLGVRYLVILLQDLDVLLGLLDKDVVCGQKLGWYKECFWMRDTSSSHHRSH